MKNPTQLHLIVHCKIKILLGLLDNLNLSFLFRRKSKGHWNLNLERKEDNEKFSESIEDLVIDLTSNLSKSNKSDFDTGIDTEEHEHEHENENYSELSLPSDLDLETDLSVDENDWTQYFSSGDKVKNFEFFLWKSDDYDLIPLVIFNRINKAECSNLIFT